MIDQGKEEGTATPPNGQWQTRIAEPAERLKPLAILSRRHSRPFSASAFQPHWLPAHLP